MEKDVLGQITELADQLHATEREIADLKAKAADAEARRKIIAEKLLPALMDQVELEEAKTSSGIRFKIKETTTASTVKERVEDLYDWLVLIGEAGAVKHQVAVPFGVKQEAKAAALLEELRQKFPEAMEVRKVEPSTLSSIIRKRLEESEDVPDDLVNVHVIREVRIIPKKKD